MKTTAFIALTSLLLAGSAQAADLMISEPVAPVYSSSSFDWSGFYAGVNLGYGGGTVAHPITVDYDNGQDPAASIGASLDVTGSGFLYGVQGGYNFLADDFLFGIEGDIQGSSIDGRVSASIDQDGNSAEIDAGTSVDWLATLRPRIGMVHDDFLVYVTGGLAYAQTTSSANIDINGSGGSIEQEIPRWGYTVGAGIEYALTDNMSFKTEYLYTDLGDEEIIGGPIAEDVDASLGTAIAFHTVRAGVNFHF